MRRFLALLALLLALPAACAQTGPGNTPANTIWGNCTGGLSALSSACIGSITGSFFSTDVPPANITRVNDRVFVGDLTKNPGDLVSTADWLCNFQINTISVGSCYIRLAQLGSETSLNPNAGVGLFGAAQTLKDIASGNVNSVGVEALAVSNNTGTGANAFAFYGECHQQTNTGTTGCIALEVDVRNNAGIAYQPDPFTQANLVGMQSACGAGITATGNDCGAAIEIVKNPSKWRVGINFVNGSVDSTGPSSTIVAVGMPLQYGIGWFSATNALASGITGDASGNVVFSANALKVNTSVGVNCPSGIVPTTTIVVGGIITHC